MRDLPLVGFMALAGWMCRYRTGHAALERRERDIDLANGRISVGHSKTEAGIRLVDILPALRDELLSHRQTNAEAESDSLIFPTSSGSRRDKDNARERVFRPVVAHADTLLAQRGHRRFARA